MRTTRAVGVRQTERNLNFQWSLLSVEYCKRTLDPPVSRCEQSQNPNDGAMQSKMKWKINATFAEIAQHSIAARTDFRFSRNIHNWVWHYFSVAETPIHFSYDFRRKRLSESQIGRGARGQPVEYI